MGSKGKRTRARSPSEPLKRAKASEEVDGEANVDAYKAALANHVPEESQPETRLEPTKKETEPVGETNEEDPSIDPHDNGELESAVTTCETVPACTVPERASSRSKPKVHVTVLLEQANLEVVKLSGSRGGHALLSSEDHGTMLKKMKREPNSARPDITHQCLLALLDSPLNKAGFLTVYVRTKKNALISVHPQTRIPRTIRRFSGLMVELLERFKVRPTNGTKPLLQVIRNPVTSHLPLGQHRALCTYNCDNIVDIRDHAKHAVEKCMTERRAERPTSDPNKEDGAEGDTEADDEPVQVLYIVGAMAHGKVEADWVDEQICMSEYPLSAATVCSRITFAYECMMDIL